MLNIKLAKVGKTNQKVFRLIISEKSRDPYGRALEILGSYNPYTKELQVKGDRVKYWLSKGSGMTATVNNLLVGQGIIEGKKVKASKKGELNEKKLAQKKKKAKQGDESKAANAPEKTDTDTSKTANDDVAKQEAKPEAADDKKEGEKEAEDKKE